MRTLREQPRMAAARFAVVAMLLVFGIAIGSASSGGDDGLAQAEQRHAALARSAASTQRELRETKEHLEGATHALRRIRSELHDAERANRQMEGELRDARRSARRKNRKN